MYNPEKYKKDQIKNLAEKYQSEKLNLLEVLSLAFDIGKNSPDAPAKSAMENLNSLINNGFFKSRKGK